jgi:hypothetical protein
MGSYFNTAATMIGRKRLPPGLVAILDDQMALGAAIGELHEYAIANREPDRPRRGIVFRVVQVWECEAIVQKLWNYFGLKDAAANADLFSLALGHMHVIDDSAMSHASNRHGAKHGKLDHLSLTVTDFMKIPDVVNPRHIVEFSVAKGTPRIVYRKAYDRHVLTVVQELQMKAGMIAIKTAYKHK